jgi:NitT/TauT family transport system substrate-binding protein
MRRLWFCRVVLALVPLACAFPLRAAEPEQVTMAVPAFSLSFSLGYLAEDLGFFAKQGIAVKQIDIQGLGAINSLIAGSSDFAEASGASLTRAAAHNQRLVAIAELLDRPFVQLVLRKDVADQAGFDPAAPLAKRALVLKGRTIGVDSINSVVHAYLRLIARAGGMDAESVQIAVTAPQSMLAGMAAKQIDGFAMTPPWPQKVLTEGGAVLVASGPDGDPADLVPFANSVLLTRPEVCEKRKSACEKMGHAFAEAAAVIQDHPDVALAALEKRFSSLDAKTMEAAFAVLRKITPSPPAPTLEAVRNNEIYNVDAGLLKPEEQLKSFDGLFTDQYVR